MHELRAALVPRRYETSKAAKTLRAMEHTSSMPPESNEGRATETPRKRMSQNKGSASHTQTHTTHKIIDLRTQIQSATHKHRHSHAYTHTHAQTLTTHILMHRPCTLVAGQALHATLHAY
jgi:hypothetical protein